MSIYSLYEFDIYIATAYNGSRWYLPGELLNFGKKALLVYGGGSIKKNGLYDKAASSQNRRNCIRQMWKKSMKCVNKEVV